jgi:hypothetical protein
MQVKFSSLVKKVEVKSLVSGDKSFHIILEGEDAAMGDLIQAPSDKQISVVMQWDE